MTMNQPDSFFESVLQRDRAIVAAALVALILAAWFYVLWLTGNMFPPPPGMTPEMNVPGMNMGPVSTPWSIAELSVTLVMWSAMMIGMMTPSAAPMILIYALVARHAEANGKPLAAVGWFAAGYLLAWCGFAVVATFAQAALVSAALITPALAAGTSLFAAVILVAAGLYQWSPLKQSCLSQCQGPLAFIQHRGGFKRDIRGALKLGVSHGLYCVGCCWALMGLLFVGGVMNPLWIAGLSIWVLLEKIVPVGGLMARGLGLVLIGGGIIFALRTLM
jgi:predicted metal-binding membrane protein